MAFLDRNPDKNKYCDYPKSGQSNKPHTRKQLPNHRYKLISGTNGLTGICDITCAPNPPSRPSSIDKEDYYRKGEPI